MGFFRVETQAVMRSFGAKHLDFLIEINMCANEGAVIRIYLRRLSCVLSAMSVAIGCTRRENINMLSGYPPCLPSWLEMSLEDEAGKISNGI